jgi:membrane protein YqaA with SNARE-associated domain
VAAPRRTNGIALIWGLAEATVFFIVPDVFLSWLALRSYRRALIACLWVVAGALLGGLAIWHLGSGQAEEMRTFYVALPAIDASMIQSVQQQLDADGLIALFLGPISGTPYKLYALEAGQLGIRWETFVLVSFPARLIRFVLVSVVIGAISQALASRCSLKNRQVLLAVSWAGFYAWYFSVMP